MVARRRISSLVLNADFLTSSIKWNKAKPFPSHADQLNWRAGLRPNRRILGMGVAMAALIHVIYASIGTQEFSFAQLTDLLNKAREANARADLTGMLLYSETDRSFFQVLEGEPEEIDRLYAKLLVDARHTRVTLIIREPIPRRTFGQWTMGFTSVTRPQLKGIPGLNDFFREGSCLVDLDPGRAKKLLAAFADGRWRGKNTATMHLGVSG
jgi:Sensors of blue-light using FAD